MRTFVPAALLATFFGAGWTVAHACRAHAADAAPLDFLWIVLAVVFGTGAFVSALTAIVMGRRHLAPPAAMRWTPIVATTVVLSIIEAAAPPGAGDHGNLIAATVAMVLVQGSAGLLGALLGCAGVRVGIEFRRRVRSSALHVRVDIVRPAIDAIWNPAQFTCSAWARPPPPPA